MELKKMYYKKGQHFDVNGKTNTKLKNKNSSKRFSRNT